MVFGEFFDSRRELDAPAARGKSPSEARSRLRFAWPWASETSLAASSPSASLRAGTTRAN